MNTVQRLDFSKSKVSDHVDSNGFVILKATPTRTGILTYYNEDGSKTRELRHPDEVFNKESMDSLRLKPFTLDHRGNFVKPETASDQVKGAVGENIEIEGDCLACNIAVYDKEALDGIDTGRFIELSAGYSCDIDQTPGVYEGENYDVSQKKIRYNHVSGLVKGRAGNSCKLRLDGKNNAVLEFIDNKKKENMSIRIDGFDNSGLKFDSFEVVENEDTKKLSKLLIEALNKIEEPSIKLDSSKTLLEAERDGLQLKLDSISKEVVELKEVASKSVPSKRLDSLITKRIQIEQMAKKVNYKLPTTGSFSEINEKASFDILKLAGYEESKLKERMDGKAVYANVAWDTYFKDSDNVNASIHSKQNLDRNSGSFEKTDIDHSLRELN